VNDERLSGSDKLGIVLACLASILAIVLFLIEKNFIVIIVFLLSIMALSIYPIIHFAKSKIDRISLFECVIVVTVFLGWEFWPQQNRADVASQQQKAPVQQTNQGNNNANINGNENTVTNTIVINRDDPKAKSLERKLDRFLKQQRLTPEKLLRKYPIGYVIFDVNYENAVFPYQARGGLEKWNIAWNTFKYTQDNSGKIIYLQLPEINYRSTPENDGPHFDSNTFTCPKKVGTVCAGIQIDNVVIAAKILEITPTGVVFILGLRYPRRKIQTD
jgi:hypothetical protein